MDCLNLLMHSLYDSMWLSAQVDINNLINVELPKVPPKPEKVSYLLHLPEMVSFTPSTSNRIRWLHFRSLAACISSTF